MAWYVNLNGQTMGPVDDAQVVAWIKSGTLLTGLVCKVGSQQWTDVASHPAFAAALLNAAPPPPPPGARPHVAAAPAVAASVRRPTPNPVAYAVGSGLRSTGRWLLLAFLVLLLLGMSATGVVGIVVGGALIGWGVFGFKRARRTAVEFVLARAQPARLAAVFTAVVGGLSLLCGIGGLLGQHEKASRKEAEAAAAQKLAAENAAKRKQLQATLLAQSPAKASSWRASLKTLSDGVAGVKKSDDLRAKLAELTALRDQAKEWLGQLDTKPSDAASAESDIESMVAEVQKMVDFVDGVSAFEGNVKDAKALIAKRSWLDADQALGDALQRATALQGADASLRGLVTGFEPERKKAEVTAMKAGIAGAVASVKAAENKRIAAEEAAKAAAQAYQAMCGEAPVLSPWDGELIGLESTIKETANDPDSIDVSKCTQPVLTKDNCWLSTCNVRGKNGFGALILQRQTWSYSKLLGFRQSN